MRLLNCCGVGLALWLSLTSSAGAQGVSSLDDLARMTPDRLNELYASGATGVAPEGRVRGLPLMSPGTGRAVALSHAGRLVWQGKVFDPATGTAVNRFLGLRVIRGRYGWGAARFDGGPSLILDYQGSSRVYARYRDEIREVAPGLYLGLMYDRRKPDSGPVRYFAFEDRRRRR